MADIRTITVAAAVAPFSDFVARRDLGATPKTLLGLTSWGTYNPGLISASLWLSPQPTSSPFGDPNVLMIEPDTAGRSFNPPPTPIPQPRCMNIPQGYRYLYGEFCNATGVIIFLAHVIRVQL